MLKRKTAVIALMVTALIAGSAATVIAQGSAPGKPTEPGTVVWYDLITEDADAVLDFYRELFGWQLVEHRPNTYVVLDNGVPIAGISQIERKNPTVSEALWLTGIAVADVDAAVNRARSRGATVHVEPKDVAGYGRYAVIADPEDAPLMLLRPSRKLGGARGPGAWIWTELWGRDLKAEAAFYREVVGYDRAQVEVNGAPYEALTSGGRPRAGLVEIPKEMDAVKTAWAPYLQVADLQATLAATSQRGGKVLVAPDALRSRGSVALIADPSGAAFFIYQAADQEVQQ